MRTICKVILALALVLPFLFAASSTRSASDVEIETAIQDGLAWLAAQQAPDGSWGDPGVGYTEAATGLAVLKFEERARDLGLDPFDPAYPYHQQVEDGLNYIFLATQPAPVGLSIVGSGLWPWHETYNTGIGMMALAASASPGRTVPPLGSAVDGWTYQAVLQGMLDWMEDAQNDFDCATGGWGYTANDGSPDQSNSGYATLGIGYAISPANGFGLTVDLMVLLKLDTFISNTQRPDGGADYSPCWPWNQSNILRTGNLLYEMALVGRPMVDPTVLAAVGYIDANWFDTDHQAMFTMMKGLEAYQIDMLPINGDWFDQVSTFIVNDQNPDGSWPENWGLHLDTPWNLLTLEKVVPPPIFDVSPDSASNRLGQEHTVTATVTDVLGNPLPGVPVSFDIISGPNAGAGGICTPNLDCTTNPSGQVSFTYTGLGGVGTDEIEGCGVQKCEVVTKEWLPPVADIKVLTFELVPPPELFVSQTYIVPAEELKHNNGPDDVTADVLWWVMPGPPPQPQINFRWVAQPGDICTLGQVPVPCGEGDIPGIPSPEGDTCQDGVDNDGDTLADGVDPDCQTDIDDIHFQVPLPVSVPVLVVRDMKVHCKEPGPFNATMINEEWPVPPAVDPDPENNTVVIDVSGECVPGVQEVDIDIKPGSFPNSINPGSNGVIPVAILSNEDFDATTVNPDTVRFGPDGAEYKHRRAHVKDANHDGLLDLLMHFPTQDTGIQSGDTEACLTGQTMPPDGLAIEGCDSVRTVPPDKDSDGDSGSLASVFGDAVEASLGTDQFGGCGPGAWGPDLDDDGNVTIFDVLSFKGLFLSQFGDPAYSNRHDFMFDGAINILDIGKLKPFFNTSCGQ